MSKKSDIIDGTDPAQLKKNYGLIYTCNAGWIDLGHLNPHNSRIEIGAANLWKQLKAEGKAVISPACGPPPSHANSVQTIAHYLGKPSRCDVDPRHRAKAGFQGFEVRYRQDHAGYPLRPGREGVYIVKYRLSTEEKKSVALSIFMEVSERFEKFQSGLGKVGLTDSGFSQEDLVSNLIGFYIAVGEVTREEALRQCHPVSKEFAEKVWERDGAVGDNKNKTWKPILADSVGIQEGQSCVDECAGQPQSFPKVFQRIKPAAKGMLFDEMPLGYRPTVR